jgi:hypothetical protein
MRRFIVNHPRRDCTDPLELRKTTGVQDHSIRLWTVDTAGWRH